MNNRSNLSCRPRGKSKALVQWQIPATASSLPLRFPFSESGVCHTTLWGTTLSRILWSQFNSLVPRENGESVTSIDRVRLLPIFRSKLLTFNLKVLYCPPWPLPFSSGSGVSKRVWPAHVRVQCLPSGMLRVGLTLNTAFGRHMSQWRALSEIKWQLVWRMAEVQKKKRSQVQGRQRWSVCHWKLIIA